MIILQSFSCNLESLLTIQLIFRNISDIMQYMLEVKKSLHPRTSSARDPGGPTSESGASLSRTAKRLPNNFI